MAKFLSKMAECQANNGRNSIKNCHILGQNGPRAGNGHNNPLCTKENDFSKEWYLNYSRGVYRRLKLTENISKLIGHPSYDKDDDNQYFIDIVKKNREIALKYH